MTDDNDLEDLALAYSSRFQALLSEARNEITTSGGIPHADFWSAVEQDQTQSEASPYK